ncbi:MAG: hypothetical protein V4490_06975 [Pseudomonadota bacterium]
MQSNAVADAISTERDEASSEFPRVNLRYIANYSAANSIAMEYAQSALVFRQYDGFGTAPSTESIDEVVVQLTVPDLQQRARTFLFLESIFEQKNSHHETEISDQPKTYTLMDRDSKKLYYAKIIPMRPNQGNSEYQEFKEQIDILKPLNFIEACGISAASPFGSAETAIPSCFGCIIKTPLAGVPLKVLMENLHDDDLDSAATGSTNIIRLIDTYGGYYFFTNLIITSVSGFNHMLEKNSLPICNESTVLLQECGTLAYSRIASLSDARLELSNLRIPPIRWNGLNTCTDDEECAEYCSTLYAREFLTLPQYMQLTNAIRFFFQSFPGEITDEFIQNVHQNAERIANILSPIVKNFIAQWGADNNDLLDEPFSTKVDAHSDESSENSQPDGTQSQDNLEQSEHHEGRRSRPR